MTTKNLRHPWQTDRWRLMVVGIWFVVTLGIATYALIKPSTSAADLVFLPDSIISWLDAQFNFRTFVMTLGVCVIPAILLSAAGWDVVRRLVLSASSLFLVSLEFYQRWIPTRGFSWEDVGYTIAAVLAVECLVVFGRRIGTEADAQRFGDDRHNFSIRGRWTMVAKCLLAVLCAVLVVGQLAYLFLVASDGTVDLIERTVR
ncbi:hypothetical protein [Stieleria mannarensis]|uniref:hypothetical protein n=1 Tax=Stieleria mannarensis TaxID=2755585 RepID=UPI001602D927|nr:hypothetical protein [Rhodopirellula sp. JC639]